MRTFAVIVALAFIAGLPNLPRPMHGDQVFFMQGGESLNRGELLYRDFWDVKQPAVFVFYWAGGRFFGFDEIGIHIFDLLYWLAFAILVACTWPRLMGEARASIWPAAMTAGWYWAVTGGVQQAQVEAIVGPLLYLHFWMLTVARLSESGRGFPTRRVGLRENTAWTVAGVVAAVVVMSKFMFLPLLAVAWLFAANRARREHGWRVALKLTLCYVIAAIVALGASAIPWLVAGEMELLKWTFFDVPGQMLDQVPRPSPKRLLEAAQWFATRYGPLGPLAIIGAVRLWRTGRREWVLFFSAWLMIGLAILVAQWLSWWSYHFMLLAIPLGLLAAEGCATLVDEKRRVWLVLLCLLLAPAIAAIGLKWATIARHNFCLRAEDRQALLLEDPVYARAKEETAFLQDGSAKPGPIFIAGEPIYYRFANRGLAVPIHGWSLELYPGEVQLKLAKQLIHAEPAYIFIDKVYYGGLIEERYPEIEALLRLEFRLVRESKTGAWYERVS